MICVGRAIQHTRELYRRSLAYEGQFRACLHNPNRSPSPLTERWVRGVAPLWTTHRAAIVVWHTYHKAMEFVPPQHGHNVASRAIEHVALDLALLDSFLKERMGSRFCGRQGRVGRELNATTRFPLVGARSTNVSSLGGGKWRETPQHCI